MSSSKPKKNNLVKKTIQGVLWAYASKYSGKVLTFISTIILARLLIQEDFGVAGYALIVIGFLEVPGLGVGSALIYYEKDPKRTYTAFWLAVAIGFSLFIFTWWVAPFMGLFFNDPRAIPVTQALALTFPLRGLGVVHEALLQKELAFKLRFIPDVSRSFSKGITAISLAWLGFGPWSLIWGQLLGTFVGLIALWIVFPWRPAFQFDYRLATPLLSYGASIVSTYVLGVLLLNTDYLFIGRFLGAAALGVYTLAFRIPELLIKQLCNTLAYVLFPVYSKMREDNSDFSQGFLISMRYLTLITVPMGLGLAVVAEPFILTLFTEKWADAIPVMSAISIYTLIRSLYFSVGSAYKAQGRPDLLTRLHILHAIFLIPALWWVTVTYGSLTLIAWTQVLGALIFGTVRLRVAAYILHIPFREILATFQSSILAGVFMMLVVLGTLQLLKDIIPPIQLVVGIGVGIFSYTMAQWWLEPELLTGTVHTVRLTLTKKKTKT